MSKLATTRHRIFKDESTMATVTRNISDYQGTRVYSSATVSDDIRFDELYDVSVPGYHKAIREGRIVATNPCYRFTYEQYAGGGSYSNSHPNPYGNGPVTFFTSGEGSVTLYELGMSPSAATPATYAEVDKQKLIELAKLDALAAIDRSPFSFMEDAAEWKKTVAYIATRLTSIGQLLLTGYRIQRKDPTAFARWWLEARYAIRPIYISIENAIDAYNHRKRDKQPYRRTHGLRMGSDSKTSSRTHYWTSDVYSQFVWVDTLQVKVRAGLLIHDEESGTILDYLGFNLEHVAETFWAVVPFSWVVDRFINISQSIMALTGFIDPSIRTLDGYITTTTTHIQTVQCVGEVTPGWTTSVSGDVVRRVTTEIDRDPWNPGILDTLPRIDVRLDLAFLADLIALILRR